MHTDPVTRSCPARTCRAPAGAPCTTSTGLIRAETHAIRWLATLPAVTKCCDDGCPLCHWTTVRAAGDLP